MRYGFRLFLMGALGVAAFALTARAADGDRVTFDTLDGVTLEGHFYKSDPKDSAKDKNATVLLLHNVGKSGGSSNQDGWDALAKTLSEDGYSVLSFDFRGFGNSHKVSMDFWNSIKGRHNRECMPQLANRNPPPDTIEHKDFDNRSSEYYPYLVNDITAAKSYLDKHSSNGQANSSNLILVGAGEGATIGAMWMESQWHLQKVSGIDPKTGRPTLDEPEGRDVAGALWLDLSPKLGEREIPAPSIPGWWTCPGPIRCRWRSSTARTTSRPSPWPRRSCRGIEARVRRENPGWNEDQIKGRLQFTDVKAIPGTKLGGSQAARRR